MWSYHATFLLDLWHNSWWRYYVWNHQCELIHKTLDYVLSYEHVILHLTLISLPFFLLSGWGVLILFGFICVFIHINLLHFKFVTIVFRNINGIYDLSLDEWNNYVTWCMQIWILLKLIDKISIFNALILFLLCIDHFTTN